MKAVVRLAEPAEQDMRLQHIRPLYLESLTLVERLHRRLLDVVKDEFDRRGRADINAAHARLLSRLERVVQSQEAGRNGFPRSYALARRPPFGPNQADREGARRARHYRSALPEALPHGRRGRGH